MYKNNIGINAGEIFCLLAEDNWRKRFVFLFVLMAISLFKISAKTPVSFGLKMEANIHEFWLYHLDDCESSKGIMPDVGCFLKVDLNDAYSIQPELSFFFRNTQLKMDGQEDNYFRQQGANIPVYLMKREYIHNSIWYFGIGPHVQIGFNAYMKDTVEDLYRKTNGKAWMNRWDYGVSTMLGCERHTGIQFNIGLQLGLKNQLQALRKESTAINKVVTLGIGYRF
jgi:hypothetical protein